MDSVLKFLGIVALAVLVFWVACNVCFTCHVQASSHRGNVGAYDVEKECPIKGRTKTGEMKNGAPIYKLELGDC